MSDGDTTRARPSWPRWAGLAVLLLLTAGIYARVLSFEFLQTDDPYYLTERPEFQALADGEDGALAALLSPRKALAGEYWEYYPVRDLSHALEVKLAGLDPAVTHGTQLGLHLVFVVLVFLLGLRLGLPPWAALGGAAAVALHPLAVEPVSWVSSRKDVLMSVLVLASLLCFSEVLRGRGRARIGWWAAAAALALLAFGSKGPGIVVVPLMIWLVAHERPSAGRRQLALGIGALALAAIAWFLMVRHVGQVNEIFWEHPDGVGRWFRALGVPVRLVDWYIAPRGLCPYYGPWTSAWYADPYAWLGFLVVTVGIAALRRCGWRIPRGVFLAGAFVLAVLPASGVVAVAHLRADRFYYLALAFAGLGVGQVGAWAWEWGGSLALPRRYAARGVAAVLAAVLFLGWIATSHFQIPNWRNQDAMWGRVMEILPEKHFVLAVRAEQLMAADRQEDARELLHRALEVADRSPQKKGRFYRAGGYRDVLWTAHIWLLLGESWSRTAARTAGSEAAEAAHRARISLQQSVAADPEYVPTYFFEQARAAAYAEDGPAVLAWSGKLREIPGITATAGARLAAALEVDGHPAFAAAVRDQWRVLPGPRGRDQ